MDKIKVLIADSQTLIREGVGSILKNSNEYIIVGYADNYNELFLLLNKHLPSIVIIDPFYLKDFLIPHLSKLSETIPLSNILAYTGKVLNEDLIKVLDYGISHFISKYCNSNELIIAINSIIKKEKYLSKEIIDALLTNYTNKKQINSAIHITNKEIEIVRLIAQGLTSKEIAEKIFLSAHTVNTHRKNIFKKLNINNTSELVMYAIKAGIIDTTEYYI